MNHKVLIKVERERCSDYASLDITLADKDRTPLLKLRVLAHELLSNLASEDDGVIRTLTDAEIIQR